MNSKVFVTAVLILLSPVIVLFLSCNKDTANDGQNPAGPTLLPKIISVTPTSFSTGSPATINGENFGTDISKIVVKLDSVSITVSSVNAQSVVINIPQTLITSGSRIFTLTITVNGKVSNTVQVLVRFEQHGWYYVNKNIDGGYVPQFIHMYDNTDSFGLIYGRGLLFSTTTDGRTWGGIWPSGAKWGEAFHVYDEDEAWIEVNQTDILMYDYEFFTPNPPTSFYARLDTITTIPALRNKFITGAFVTKRRHGYLLTHDGSVLKVKGSFAPSNIQLEYQSSVYADLPSSFENNNYYQISGVDSSNFMIMARPKVNNVTRPMIIHKKNGTYVEYNLTAQLGTGWPMSFQLVDANTAYMLSIHGEMYKLNMSTNSWVKLTTPVFRTFVFLNANVGYAGSGFVSGQDYRFIYKTTDGGATWVKDFDLDPFFYPYAMCTKNGKVWMLGQGIISSKSFVAKFNP